MFRRAAGYSLIHLRVHMSIYLCGKVYANKTIMFSNVPDFFVLCKSSLIWRVGISSKVLGSTFNSPTFGHPAKQ